MGIGVSLILIAVGAILAFAVNATVSGLEVTTIGWILMVVGIAGLILSLMFWSSWGGFGGAGARRRTTYVDDAPPRELHPHPKTPRAPARCRCSRRFGVRVQFARRLRAVEGV